MAFAIFLNDDDLLALSGQARRQDMPTEAVDEAIRFWDGGLRNWDHCPFAEVAEQLGDPNTRILAMNPQARNLEDFVAFLRRIPGYFPGDDAALYMDSLADHIKNTSVEPYSSSS